MPTTTTTETTPEQLAAIRNAAAMVRDAAAWIREQCDSPRGARAILDEHAANVYHAGDALAGAHHSNLVYIGNRLWSMVDELDRLRDELDNLEYDLAALAADPLATLD